MGDLVFLIVCVHLCSSRAPSSASASERRASRARRASPEPREPAGRAQLLLAIGALAGLVLAAVGALRPAGADEGELPEGAIARVNDRIIQTEEYLLALDLLGGDRREPLTPDDRAYVLGRLIDEELLVQRGEDLGLTETERTVRSAIAQSMIQMIVSEAESVEPTEDELRAFFEENRGLFHPPDTLSVHQITVYSDGDEAAARDRALAATAALRGGGDFEAARAAYGDVAIVAIPEVPLPPGTLREYVGPGALRALLSAEPGEVVGPLPAAGGYQVLALVGRTSPPRPTFESVRDQVAGAYRVSRGDQALRGYLDRLRDDASIELGADAPELTP